MQQKLRDLMTSEHLKSGQLAEALGINPAGISHILAGRNKPGFDLLQKILRRFPKINPDWLLLDQGPMYRSDYDATNDTPAKTQEKQIDPIEKQNGLFGVTSKDEPKAAVNPNGIAPVSPTHAGRIARVVIFYDDQTFESFTPNR